MATTAESCGPCAHALTHGWWGATVPQGRIHHRCCHITISGKRPHCVACCRTFTTERAADLHRRGGHCLDPATITTRTGIPRLKLRPDGIWGQAGEYHKPTSASAQTPGSSPQLPQVPPQPTGGSERSYGPLRPCP